MAEQERTSNEQSASSLQGLVVGLVLALVGLVVSIGALEIALRLLPPPKPPLNDRPAVYYVPEGSTTLQDFPVKLPKPANTFRIAAVGDSFTFGPYIQFDDTYAERMERFLNLNTNQATRVDVVNYGVPRYSTFHQVGSVKRALEEGADLILLQITLNDPELKLDWPTELIPDETGQLGDGSTKAWWRRLKTVDFVLTRFDNTRSQRLYREYFFKLFDRNARNYETFLNAFTDIRKLCERSNVPVIAVVFPLFGVEVGPEYPFWPLHSQVAEDLKQRAIRSFDISERFTGLPVERLQVLPGFDRHPNEIGHRIAAEAIIQELHTRNLLPPGVFPHGLEPRRIGINSARKAAATSSSGAIKTQEAGGGSQMSIFPQAGSR